VLHPDPHVLNNVRIPKFNPKDRNHIRLSELSRKAHRASVKGDSSEIQRLEDEIDRVAGKVWGLAEEDLREIRESLSES
jgi:hypothetical protein